MAEKDKKPEVPPSPQPKKQQHISIKNDVLDQMVELWVKIVEGGGMAIELGEKIKAFLYQALKQRFEGQIEKWKAFCEKIASSKYLLGEKEIKGVISKKWRITLDWALRFSNIDKILEGNLYGFGDRSRPLTPTEIKNQTAEMVDEINNLHEPEKIKQVRRNLLAYVGRDAYFSYFRNATLSEKENVLVVKAQYAFTLSKIRSEYDASLLKAIQGLFAKVMCGDIEIKPDNFVTSQKIPVVPLESKRTVQEPIKSTLSVDECMSLLRKINGRAGMSITI